MRNSLKYLIWGLVALVLIVVSLVLLLLRQRRLAGRLAHALRMEKIDTEVEQLKTKKVELLNDRSSKLDEVLALEVKLDALARDREESKLKIEGMSNEEVTARLRDLGY